MFCVISSFLAKLIYYNSNIEKWNASDLLAVGLYDAASSVLRSLY